MLMEKNIRLLYWGNEPAVLKNLQVLQSNKGWEVFCCYEKEICEQAFIHDIDLILCDLELFLDSASEFIHKNNKKGIEIPFIFISLTNSIEKISRAFKSGAADVISPPSSIEKLETIIGEAIEKNKHSLKNQFSKKLWDTLHDELPDIIYSLNPGGEFIYANSAGERILGYRISDFIGTSVFKFIHPDDREWIKQRFGQFVREKNSNVNISKFRMLTATGDVKHFEIHSHLVIENASVIRSDGIARDITEQVYLEKELKANSISLKKKNKELEQSAYLLGKANVELLATKEKLEVRNKESEKLLQKLAQHRDELQAIIDAAPDVILMVNLQNKIVAANKGVKIIFGIEPEKILNQNYDYFLEQIKDCFVDFDAYLKLVGKVNFCPADYLDIEFEVSRLYDAALELKHPKQRWIFPLIITVSDAKQQPIGRICLFNDITAIKKADEHLRTIVKASPVPLLVSRVKDGKILFINNHLAEMLGYQSIKLMGKSTPDFYYNPADRQNVLERLNRDGSIHSLEIQIRAKDGEPFWVNLASELTEIGGETVVITGLYNIHERKKAEEALRKERNFVSAVLDTARALVVVLDLDARIVRFNRACEELTGYKFSEVRGKNFGELFLLHDEKTEILNVFGNLVAGNFPNQHENYWLTKDNRRRLISWSNTVLRDAEGVVEHVISTGIDITEQRQAKDALLASERKYRELVENSSSIILRWNRFGQVTFLNEFGQRFLGFSKNEIIGRNVVGTIVPEYDSNGLNLKQQMDEIERNPEKFISNENENLKRNGERVWITWANKPIFDDEGNVQEILSIGKDVTDRKKAEDELKRAHRIYREAIENVEGVPYLKYFSKSAYEYIGEGVTSLLGMPIQNLSSDIIEKLTKEIVVTDPYAPLDPKEYLESFLRGEVKHYRADLHIETIEGEEKWISDCAVPVIDEQNGTVIGSLGILQDITQRKLAEDKLRLYRKVFLNSLDGIMIFDPNGKFIERNPSNQKMLRLSENDLNQESFSNIFGIEATEAIVNSLAQTGIYKGEIEYTQPDKSIVNIDLSIFPIFNETGEIVAFTGIGRDITQRKEAEQMIAVRLRYERELAACSQELLSELPSEETIPTAISHLLHASKASRVYIFENSLDKRLGLCMKPAFEVCDAGIKRYHVSSFLRRIPYEPDFNRWRENLSQGKPIKGIISTFPKEERQHLEEHGILSMLILPLKIRGEWHGFIGFDDEAEPREWDEEDVRLIQTAAEMLGAYLERKQVLDDLNQMNRHLKETQSQLVQSEKMASLGTLVAGIAHEINTPVGAVNSMHDTLMRAIKKLKTQLESNPPSDLSVLNDIQKTLRIIEDANRVIDTGTDRVTNIVRRLRSFARLDEAEMKSVDIHEGLEDTLTLIHHEIKHHIKIIKQYGELPEVTCYPGQLNQVFLNILMNARQAIKGEGEIIIKTFIKNHKVHISFQDNGVGIVSENLSKIFDPGFTTKGVGLGTGLGLSICFKIIKAHLGEIKVKSEPGKGSTFTIIFPENLDKLLPFEAMN